MKVSEVSWGVALLLGSVGAWAEGQPVCRWLDLDDTRVFQCAVLPEVAADKTPINTEGLPDPTQPLSKQMDAAPRQAPINLAEIIPNKERFKQDFVATAPAQPAVAQEPEVAKAKPPVKATRYLVLAQGETELVKQRLRRENVADFAYLPARQRLSLGLYSSKANATRRLEALQRIGIAGEIEQLGGKKQEVVEAAVPAREVAEKMQQAPKITEPMQPAVLSKPTEYGQLAIANVPSTEATLLKVSATNAGEPKPEISHAVNGYIVASLGDTEEVLKVLQLLPTSDYIKLRRGPYRGRVSVGVYSSLENAYARQAFMQQQGIDTEVIARDEQQVIRTTLPTLSYPQIALIPLDV